MTEIRLTKEDTLSAKEKEHKLALADIIQNKINILSRLNISTKSEPQALTDQILAVLDFFDIDEVFFLSSQGKIRPYILIGLVDEWLQTSHLDEKKGIFDLIKILSSQEWKDDNESKNLSNRVIKQAEAGEKSGYEFVSGYKLGQNTEVWAGANQYADENIDLQKTKQLEEEISLKNQNSFLNWIRAQLNIKDTEKPFSVKVLSKTTEEVGRRLNGTIAFFSRGVLCVPSDYDEHIVEHEYIHSQQLRLNIGSNGILGRGLMEAWTEEQTQSPKYYEPQRKILSYIQQQLPSFFDKLKQFSSKPIVNTLDAIYIHLLSGFGLEGLVAAIRMESDGVCRSENSSDYHGKFVFKKTDQVQSILETIETSGYEDKALALEDPELYLEDDLKIFKIKKDRETDSEKRVNFERAIHQTEFYIAISKAKSSKETDNSSLRNALDIYQKHLLGTLSCCEALVSELIKDQNKSEILLQMTIQSLETNSNDDLYGLTRRFISDVDTTRVMYFFNHSNNDDWSNILTLEKRLQRELFERHSDDYRLGYQSLGTHIISNEPTEEQVNQFLNTWEKTKQSISSQETHLNFDSKILINTAWILSHVDFNAVTDEQKINILNDVNWLIDIIKRLSSLSEDEQKHIDYAIEKINKVIHNILP